METRGAGGADDARGRGAGAELGGVTWVGAGRGADDGRALSDSPVLRPVCDEASDGADDGWTALGVRARTELVSFAVDGETADGPTAVALAGPTTFSGFMRATIQLVPC